jgi:hypothetical protein
VSTSTSSCFLALTAPCGLPSQLSLLNVVPWLRVFGSKSSTPVCMAMGAPKIFKTCHEHPWTHT